MKNYEEQEKLLQACYNKLRVGGYIIISEVDKFPKWKYIISLFADYILYPFERINYRSVEDFTSLLKKINFFFATLIGIIPQIFLAVSIGSGLEKIIDQNAEVPGITDIIFSPDIYVPISAFFILILITIFLRKFFYRN